MNFGKLPLPGDIHKVMGCVYQAKSFQKLPVTDSILKTL